MKVLFKKSLIGAALSLAVSGVYAADTTITNGSITAKINDGGTFSVGSPFGTGVPGLSFNGVEFINIDNPSSWWTLDSAAGNIATAQYNSNPLGSTTFGGGVATTTLAIGALSFVQTMALTAPNILSVSLSITNNGDVLSGLKYGVGFDADQGGSGKNITTNTIVGQGANASVSAADYTYGTNLGVSLVNTTSASAYSIAAYINSGNCCGVVTPGSALSAGQAVGFSTLADDSISLAYDIGTLGHGSSATIGYNYVFAPVPEPETYAMLMAGLGLMGVIARRRKQLSA